MGYPFFYFDPTMLIVLPGLLLALWAQFKVNSTYSRYSRVGSRRGMTAAQAARMLLDENGLSEVRIERIGGRLSDHYDPRAKVLRLSDDVMNSTSVAALGVAAHEAGHAVQDATNYRPLMLRSALATLESGAILDSDELRGAKAVLSAAALTYVASALQSILNLLRLLVISGGRRRD